MKPVTVDDSVAGEVVELRIHGVSGTRPQDMLGDPYPRQVAGDEAARVFRRTTPIVEPFHGRQRVVEAFHWGRFTSGAASRALWLLLVPFALINLARYAMLLPHEAGPRAARDRASTLVLRLLGLALTLLLVVSAGFIGWAIGAPKLSWWEGGDGYHVLVGALPCAVVVALTWWFGRQVFIHDPPGGPQPWRTPYGSFDDVGFWTGSPMSSRHRAAHTVASLGIVGLMALALVPMPTWRTWSWLFFFLLVVGNAIAIATGLVVIGVDSAPEGTSTASTPTDSSSLPARLVSLRRWLALPATVLAVAYAAWAVDQNDRAVPWTTPSTEAVCMVSLVVAVLLVVFAATCAWQLRDAAAARLKVGVAGDASYPLVPQAFRPFWYGWGAWLLATVASFLAFGLSTVAVYWADKVAGGEGLPFVFSVSAVVWGVVGILVVVALVPVAAVVLQRPAGGATWLVGLVLLVAAAGLDRNGEKVTFGDVTYLVGPVVLVLALRMIVASKVPDPFDPTLASDYPADGPDGGGADALERGRSQVRARWFITEARTRYHWIIGVLAAFSGLSLLAAGVGSAVQLWFWFGPDGRRGSVESGQQYVPGQMLALGIAVLSLLASSLIALGLSTWRDPEKRRTVGIIWDLLSFWPRDAHPLCPPPYGGRAVLGAATRAVQLTEGEDDGGLGASSVVISGHSQGSLIGVASVAVLARLDPSTTNSPPQDTAGDSGESFWLERSRAERAIPKVSLVTYGSQLQFLYGRLFPTYFGFGRLTWLYSEALRRTPAGTPPLPPERLSRWRNLYRWTDPLGAPVLSWPLDGERPGPQTVRWTTVACAAENPCPGHLPESQDSPLRGVEHRWYVIGPDIRLVDPAVVVESAFAPRLAPRGHSDYPLDPVFDAIVADLATEPPPSPRPEEIDLTTPTDVTDQSGPTASGAEPPPPATVGPEATDHQRVDDWGTSAS